MSVLTVGGLGRVRGELNTADRSAHRGPTATDRWVGVEHEFRVICDGRQVDFRIVLERLGIGTAHLDPGDGRARRLRSGAVVTADGKEAEVATPPVGTVPGFSAELLGHAARARNELASALKLAGDVDHRLEGYSTHISVQVDRGREVRAARRFVATFAPAMMLLMDGRDSPGLLVRPRPGRLELCGEFVDGADLRTAIVFASAAVASIASGRPPRLLRVRGRVEPARDRFGWYLDRHAYGCDLYADGRSAQLPGRTAQDHLERCWASVRPFTDAFASRGEVAAVDDVIAGRRPLPCEQTASDRASTSTARVSGLTSPSRTEQTGAAFGSALTDRRRGDLVLRPRIVTWPLVVLDVSPADDPSACFHLAIPGERLAVTLERLDGGELDDALGLLLASRERLGTLASVEQVKQVDAFGSIVGSDVLVPRERDPLTGRLGGPGGPGSRRDKEQQRDPSRRPPRPPRQLLIAGAVIAAVIVAIVAAVALSGGDEGDDLAATGGVVPTFPDAGEPTAPQPGEDDPAEEQSLEALNGTYGVSYSEPRVVTAAGAWANVVFNYDCFADGPDFGIPGQDLPRPFRMSSEDGEGGCVGTEGPTWPEPGSTVTVECVLSRCNVIGTDRSIMFTLEGSLEDLDALGMPNRDPCTDAESDEPRVASLGDGVPTTITSSFLVNSGYSEDGFVGCDGGTIEVERDITLIRDGGTVVGGG